MMGKSLTFRPDIQGLRAIAVTAVVLFHFFPDVLPGGYVGVDVFFVISGYLMTALLFREAQSTGRVSLLNFYGRRARRILPAATTVLLAVTLATPLLPLSQWPETVTQITASALYVQNWVLAALSVDYLAQDSALSPVRHFWSLSIEEQFYLFWPVLVLATSVFALRRSRDVRRVLLYGIGAIVALSFIASVVETVRDPDLAYFVTYTRVWELGLGGLLSLVAPIAIREGSGGALRLAGLGAILGACVLFSSKTSFPGYAALLPALGAAALIFAAHGEDRIVYRLLKAPPLQYVGDTSYSLYLWHWPILVFWPAIFERDLTLADKLVAILLTVIISHFSKTLIEDRFRHKRPDRQPSRVIALGLASVLGCVAGAQLVPSLTFIPAATQAAVHNGIDPAVLLRARNDVPEIYANNCHISSKRDDPNPCEYGRRNGKPVVVLIGDSHAAQWAPALIEIAKRKGWRLIIDTKVGCPLLNAHLAKRNGYPSCFRWGRLVLKNLEKDPPDVVIIAQDAPTRLANEPDNRGMAPVVAATWRELQDLGASVIALRDTPRLSFQPTDCLSTRADCSIPRKDALPKNDPTILAHALDPSVSIIDMTDYICPGQSCSAAIAGKIVWRDNQHLTASFAKSLAPMLLSKLEPLLRQPRRSSAAKP